MLRMLGSTRDTCALYFGESILLGILGSCLGIGSGLLIARTIASFIGTYLGEVYGVSQRTDEIVANPALTHRIGDGRRDEPDSSRDSSDAARVDPVLALQKGQAQTDLRCRKSNAQAKCPGAAGVGDGSRLPVHAAPALVYASFGLTIAAALLLAPAFSSSSRNFYGRC